MSKVSNRWKVMRRNGNWVIVGPAGNGKIQAQLIRGTHAFANHYAHYRADGYGHDTAIRKATQATVLVRIPIFDNPYLPTFPAPPSPKPKCDCSFGRQWCPVHGTYRT